MSRTRDLSAGGFRIVLEFERVRVSCPDCGVRMEYLDWLARNPRYTARYVLHVGALCRKMTVKDVAQSERLHHTTTRKRDRFIFSALRFPMVNSIDTQLGTAWPVDGI